MRSSGFSLIELMITVAVSLILLSVAIPNYASFVTSTRLTTQTNDWIGALHLARSEAIRRSAEVSLVSLSGSGAWEGGWQVRVDATGQALRRTDVLDGGSTLRSAAGSVTFLPGGFAVAGITLQLCAGKPGGAGRRIQVSASGKVETTTENCP